MELVTISDQFAVTGQPERDDFRHFAARGFAKVINVRPDGEEATQLGTAAEQRAAQDAGIAYDFVPVTGATITQADIDAFRAARASSKGPVVAHCKSGTRALTLYALTEVADGRMDAEAVAAFGGRYGFDLSAATRWLAKREHPRVKGFFDPRTSSVQYVIADEASQRCAIVDPVLDFDEKSGAIATTCADALLAYVKSQGLTVEWILETHPHADHFSAAQYLKQKTGARTGIGARVIGVQKLWNEIYNLPAQPEPQWDHLFTDGESFAIGTLEGRVLHSPGHTPASVTYIVGDAAFVHDTLFMPDGGTARADFPGGDARTLWRSIQDILALPDTTRLFTGHDYQPNGRHPRWEFTIADAKRANAHIAGVDEAGFIELREARDRTLSMPKLLLHALQVNIRGGRLPEAEGNGRRYLKIPIDAFPGAVW